MSLDGQSLAGVKNRIGKSQLNAELYRIDREKKAEMRMHNTFKQRFRAKYAKLDYYSERGKDASDVRMYETHNPGFCYRRNGECRIPQSSNPAPKVDFEDLHSLLFTNGEVDMDKVLCLHLLTAHRTETLTPPAKYHRALSFLTKEQSPLERLIERSRRRRQEDSLTRLLPTYVLDVKKQKEAQEAKGKEDVLIRDGRLAERVIINDKITQLVHTVMAALKESNPDKMKEFTTMAKDQELLGRIIEKPHIQDFLKSLGGHMLVSSCDAFHLTPPFKTSTIPLTLETSGDSLRNLVKQIRKNVLQFPEQSTWKNMYYKSQSRSTEDGISVEAEDNRLKHSTLEVFDDEVNSFNDQPSTSKRNFVEKNKESAGKYKGISPPLSARGAKNMVARSRTGPKGTKGKISDYQTSIKGSKSSKYETNNKFEKILSTSTLESEERVIYDVDFLKATDVKGLASMLSSKTTSKYGRKNVVKQELENSNSKAAPLDDVSTVQMTCPTCLTKWDTADVKMKRVKKKAIPSLDRVTDEDIKSGSIKKLSVIIDQEIKKMYLEEKKPSKTNKTGGSTTPASTKVKGVIPLKKLETVTLDVLDLARIGQEIRENETQKKVKEFMERKD